MDMRCAAAGARKLDGLWPRMGIGKASAVQRLRALTSAANLFSVVFGRPDRGQFAGGWTVAFFRRARSPASSSTFASQSSHGPKIDILLNPDFGKVGPFL